LASEAKGRGFDPRQPHQHSKKCKVLAVEAVAPGLVAAFVTTGAVSCFAHDSNLLLTFVPALVVGLTVFSVTLRRFRRSETN
jgi:hypothetical protein